VYDDDNFEDTDWELIELGIGVGGSVSMPLIASGGCASPPLRRVSLLVNDPTATVSARVFAFQRRVDAVWSPPTQGPLSWIDCAECAGAPNGFSHATGPALLQGGQVFLCSGLATTGALHWHTPSLPGLTAAGFDLVDFNPVTGLDPHVHPDFSLAGAGIELGFWRGLGIPPGGVGNVGSTTSIDHWRMTLVSCPVPSAYCTAGSSASGCRAALSATGLASASASSGFTLQATFVAGRRDLFFYGTSGRQANPWGNGSSS
jgi:hypothetical protein